MSRLRCCIALSCAIASLAAAPASRPSVSTQHDELKVAGAYNRRTLVDAYDATGRRDPKWDAAAHALLDRMATRFSESGVESLYCGDAGVGNDTMLALAEAAKDCPDPLVQYCRAAVFRNAERDGEFAAMLREAAPKVIDGNYPVYRRAFAANALAGKFPDEPQWKKKRDDLFVPLLLEKTSDPRERRFVLQRVLETAWGRDRNRGGGVLDVKAAERQTLIDAFAADPKADPWLLNMMRGYHEISYAWEFRGSGWANSVTPEGWAGFREHIAAARRAFTAAYEAEPNYPEAAASMGVVCMAESVDGREWFDRAIAAQIDYLPAWFSYAESLRPRWGGSMKAMLALGREAVDSGRFDTMTPFFLGDLIGMMRQERGAGDAVYRMPGVWAALDDMHQGYLTKLPRGLNVPWVGTCRAVYAWRCGQYAEAKRTLDTIGEQLEPAAFDFFDTELAEVRNESEARGGPHAGEIKKLDVQETLKRYAAAADGYDKLVAAMGKDDPSRAFCARRRVVDRMAASLVAGKAVEVPIGDPDAMAAWRGDTSAWKPVDGLLVFDGKHNATAQMLHAVPLPDDCRITVEWSWTTPGNHTPGFDVILRRTEEYGNITAETIPHSECVRVQLGGKYNIAKWQAPQGSDPAPADAWHTLTLHCNTEAITVEHDGQAVIRNAANEWLGRGKPVLGLVGHSGPGETSIRVRKIVIERE